MLARQAPISGHVYTLQLKWLLTRTILISGQFQLRTPFSQKELPLYFIRCEWNIKSGQVKPSKAYVRQINVLYLLLHWSAEKEKTSILMFLVVTQ